VIEGVHESRVISVHLDAVNNRLVSVGAAGTIVLTAFDSGRQIARNNMKKAVKCAALDRPTYLLALGTADSIIVFDLRSLGTVRRFTTTNVR
jgi:hypothetical protein